MIWRSFRDEKVREVFVTGREQTDEFVHADARGPRYFESQIVPEFAPDGTVDKVLYISRDVTDRVRATNSLSCTWRNRPMPRG